jgi:hypothetical protein
MLKEVMGERMGEGASFIPLSALATSLKGIYNVGEGVWNQDLTWAELVNASRIFPYIGDTLVRGALHLGTEDLRLARAIGGTSRSTKKFNYDNRGGNMGMDKPARDKDLIKFTSALMQELDFNFGPDPLGNDFTKGILDIGSYSETAQDPQASLRRSSDHLPVVTEYGDEVTDKTFDVFPKGESTGKPERRFDQQFSNIVEKIKSNKGPSGKLADAIDPD